MVYQKKGTQNTDTGMDIDIGHHEIVIKKRYEFYYTLNEILIGIWFTVGSVLFFWEALTTAGTWLFVIGSIEFLLRPLIRLSQNIRLRRMGSEVSSSYINHQKVSALKEETQQKIDSLEKEVNRLKNHL